jgi:hypothetical protein
LALSAHPNLDLQPRWAILTTTQQLEASYGMDLERLRTLHAACSPEAALFVRLELLEGIAAFHLGHNAEVYA